MATFKFHLAKGPAKFNIVDADTNAPEKFAGTRQSSKQDRFVVLNFSGNLSQANTGECGFTLLEALVALAIMAAGLAAIGRVGYSSEAAALRAVRRLELTSAAQAALTALPDRRASRDGDASGTILNERWRLFAAPYVSLSSPGPIDSGWAPQRLELEVRDPTGGTVVVETVRLRRSGK